MDEQQPITRGERWLAIGCLIGAAVIAYMAVDVIFNLTGWLSRARLTPADAAYMQSAAEANA